MLRTKRETFVTLNQVLASVFLTFGLVCFFPFEQCTALLLFIMVLFNASISKEKVQ